MTTATEFVDKLKTQDGDPYIYGTEVDLNDPDPVAFDCSEIVQWACAQLHVVPVMPDGSWLQARHCARWATITGNDLDVDQAIATPGALLFRFSSNPYVGGRPASAHVAVSQGYGTTIEARSRLRGVGQFSSFGRGWTHAAFVPGIDYTQEPDMSFDYTPPEDLTDEEGEIFADAWQWADDAGIVNEHTVPTDIVEKQEMIVFLHRAFQKVTRPALFTLAECVDDLQTQINALQNGNKGLGYFPVDVRISKIP